MRNPKLIFNLFVVTATLFVPHTVEGQNTPKVELFGGYSYLRLAEQPAPDLNTPILNGWDASIKLNVARRFGLLADIGGNYGERGCSLCTTGSNQYTFLIGPEYKVLQHGRMRVSLHVLAGMAHTSSLAYNYQSVRKAYWFAASAGGSVDYRISDRVTYRVIQPELLTTAGNLWPYGPSREYANLRVSTGLLFGFANR